MSDLREFLDKHKFIFGPKGDDFEPHSMEGIGNTRPNIKSTWAPMGIEVESFDEWQANQNRAFASLSAAKLCYLDSLYQQRIAFCSESLIGDNCPFAKEVRLACDYLSVTGSSELADRLIQGERLNPSLHEEYVQETKCYG